MEAKTDKTFEESLEALYAEIVCDLKEQPAHVVYAGLLLAKEAGAKATDDYDRTYTTGLIKLMRQTLKERVTYRVVIQMGPDEWDRNGLMIDLAKEQFVKHESLANRLFVDVWEHAGWSMGFALIDGAVRCVASANDTTFWPENIIEKQKSLFGYGVTQINLDTIHRGRQAK